MFILGTPVLLVANTGDMFIGGGWSVAHAYCQQMLQEHSFNILHTVEKGMVQQFYIFNKLWLIIIQTDLLGNSNEITCIML